MLIFTSFTEATEIYPTKYVSFTVSAFKNLRMDESNDCLLNHRPAKTRKSILQLAQNVIKMKKDFCSTILEIILIEKRKR